MSPRTRTGLLGTALLATLGLTVWTAQQPEPEVIGPASSAAVSLPTSGASGASAASAPSTPSSTPPSSAATGADTAGRPAWAEVDHEQLSAWEPPPPPAPPAPPPSVAAAALPPSPPPPPVAPPLAYQLIGRLAEGDGAAAQDTALLSGADRVISVKRGDLIDGQWRVDQVSATGIQLTWLPAKVSQTLAFRAVP